MPYGVFTGISAPLPILVSCPTDIDKMLAKKTKNYRQFVGLFRARVTNYHGCHRCYHVSTCISALREKDKSLANMIPKEV